MKNVKEKNREWKTKRRWKVNKRRKKKHLRIIKTMVGVSTIRRKKEGVRGGTRREKEAE